MNLSLFFDIIKGKINLKQMQDMYGDNLFAQPDLVTGQKNEKGETLLPSKNDPMIRRWQKEEEEKELSNKNKKQSKPKYFLDVLLQDEDWYKKEITSNKPPYEMTLKEYSDAVYNGEINFNTLGADETPIRRYVDSYHATDDPQNKAEVKKGIDSRIESAHLGIIFDALMDNKVIPKNVIKDYPDYSEWSNKNKKQSKSEYLLDVLLQDENGHEQGELKFVDEIIDGLESKEKENTKGEKEPIRFSENVIRYKQDGNAITSGDLEIEKYKGIKNFYVATKPQYDDYYLYVVKLEHEGKKAFVELGTYKEKEIEKMLDRKLIDFAIKDKIKQITDKERIRHISSLDIETAKQLGTYTEELSKIRADYIAGQKLRIEKHNQAQEEKKQVSQVQEQEKKEAIIENYMGYLDGKNAMARGKIIADLDKVIDLKLKDGSRQNTKLGDAVKFLLSRGSIPETTEVPKYDYDRKKYNRMDYEQQKEYEKKSKEKKTQYTIGGYVLGKTAYDYADYLYKNNKIKAEKSNGETIMKGVDKQVEDVLNLFKGRKNNFYDYGRTLFDDSEYHPDLFTGQTNERGEQLLPSKVNPTVRRYQKVSEKLPSMEEMIGKMEQQYQAGDVNKERFDNTIKIYAEREQALKEARKFLEKKIDMETEKQKDAEEKQIDFAEEIIETLESTDTNKVKKYFNASEMTEKLSAIKPVIIKKPFGDFEFKISPEKTIKQLISSDAIWFDVTFGENTFTVKQDSFKRLREKGMGFEPSSEAMIKAIQKVAKTKSKDIMILIGNEEWQNIKNRIDTVKGLLISYRPSKKHEDKLILNNGYVITLDEEKTKLVGQPIMKMDFKGIEDFADFGAFYKINNNIYGFKPTMSIGSYLYDNPHSDVMISRYEYLEIEDMYNKGNRLLKQARYSKPNNTETNALTDKIKLIRGFGELEISIDKETTNEKRRSAQEHPGNKDSAYLSIVYKGEQFYTSSINLLGEYWDGSLVLRDTGEGEKFSLVAKISSDLGIKLTALKLTESEALQIRGMVDYGTVNYPKSKNHGRYYQDGGIKEIFGSDSADNYLPRGENNDE